MYIILVRKPTIDDHNTVIHHSSVTLARGRLRAAAPHIHLTVKVRPQKVALAVEVAGSRIVIPVLAGVVEMYS